jgi:hypothetical protein
MPTKVLVLDPSASELDALVDRIERACGDESRVVRALDARALERAIEEHAWDLLVVDLRLGDGVHDGLSVLTSVRALIARKPLNFLHLSTLREYLALEFGGRRFILSGRGEFGRVANPTRDSRPTFIGGGEFGRIGEFGRRFGCQRCQPVNPNPARRRKFDRDRWGSRRFPRQPRKLGKINDPINRFRRRVGKFERLQPNRRRNVKIRCRQRQAARVNRQPGRI